MISPKKLIFKRQASSVSEYRDQICLARWFAERYGCLFGRGPTPAEWNFKREGYPDD